jgi:ribosomal protein S12 methylthiotransferase
MGQLKANKIAVEHQSEKDDSNIVVVNTCGFIDNAKEESVNTILEQIRRKENGEIEKLFVTGCLSERYKPDLEKEMPNVDEFFGTRDLPRLLKSLGADYKHELVGERLTTTPTHYAYLKISEGCDRKCSFCAIPLMRGGHKTTPIEDLVLEAEKLAVKGVKELILIAQDLTYYGLDLYKERKLAELMTKLSEVEGIEWIRIHYAFPTAFPVDVLEVIKNNPKICTYLDIPLQHVSDNLLKSMRRGTTMKKTMDLIKKFRENVPGITIRTSLIVGYPGETEKEFQELLDFVQHSKFDRLGVFTYSHEENTHAYNLEDDVPQDVKHQRAEDVMDLQSSISYDMNQERVGKTYKVLFDRKEGDFFIGRTEFDSPDVDNEVIVNAKEFYVRIGDFANIKITKADHYDLYGEVVS